jgi:hypothetical protein
MLKPYKTKEEIPAEQQAAAIELKDGTFVVDEPADDSVHAGALDKERKARTAAEALAKKAADELKKLQTEQKAAEHGLTAEKLQEIRTAVRKEVEDELKPKLEAADKHASENRTLKLDNQVKQLAAKAGFKGDKLDDYWRLHSDEFDLTDDGKPIVKANPGESVEKKIEAHKKLRPEWVEGTKASGGGAAGVTTGGAAATGLTSEQLLANPSAALAQARKAGAKE